MLATASRNWRFKDWPLRWKLNFLAFMVFLPAMVGGTAYVAYEVYWLQVKTALGGLMNFADAKQQGIIRFLGQNEKLARQLADQANAADATSLRRHFRAVVATDVFDLDRHPFKDEIVSGKRTIPTWKTYHAIDWVRQGRIVASSDPTREGREWMRALDLKAGHSEVYREGASTLLTFAAAIRDGGMIYVHADARMLTLLVNGEIGNMEGGMGAFFRAGVAKTLDYYLVDANNVMITESRARPDAVLKLKGNEYPWQVSRQNPALGIVCSAAGTHVTNARITTGCRETMGFYQNRNDEKMLGVSLPFHNSGWTLVIEQEASDLLVPLWSVYSAMIAVCLLLLAGSVFMYFRATGRHIVAPLVGLTAAIRRVFSEDHQIDTRTRHDTGNRDELGDISRAFDELLGRLQESSVSRSFLNQVIEHVGNAIFVTDDAGKISLVNAAAVKLTGHDAAQLEGQPLKLHLTFVDSMATDDDHNADCRAANGRSIPVACTTSRFKGGEIIVALDLRERIAVESELRLAAEVINTTSQGLLITDVDGIIVAVNPAFCEVTGYSREESVGNKPSMLRSGRHSASFYQSMWHALETESHWQGEVWNRRKNGEIYPEWLSLSVVRNRKGMITHYVALFFDITERKQQEEDVWHKANFDALTGLANRSLFHDRLERALAKARRSQLKIGVLFIDLDGFKRINDTLGHDVGDKLLVEAADRLKNCVRDLDTVARLGGDEFTIVVHDLADTDVLLAIGEKVIATLRAPFTLGDADHYISGSVGITVFPDDGVDVQTLLRNADIAMYKSKQSGKNRFQFYAHHMQSDALARMRIETDLRVAIEQRAFALHYQPIVDADSGELVGAEALIRWRHPERGLISPLEFIPVAEECGLIVAIGEWALGEAMRQWQRWRALELSPLRIAVNVSGVQFREPDLANLVARLLEQNGLDRGSLMLEITESVLMDGSDAAEARMLAIKKLGVGFALDDFGTGFSSLSYLKRFPVDVVKIDRSFVNDCPDDRSDAHLVEAIINMAHSLDLRVTAEGVETEAQMKFLRNLGCDYLQGYLISKPVAADEFEALVRRHFLLPAEDGSSVEGTRLLSALRQDDLDVEDWLRRLLGERSPELAEFFRVRGWAHNGLDLKEAVRAHLQWRQRINDYVGARRSASSLDVDEASSSSLCVLGQWIAVCHNEGDPHLGSLDQVHREFHRFAGQIIADYNQGHRESSRRALTSLKFRTASRNVVVALIDYFQRRTASVGLGNIP